MIRLIKDVVYSVQENGVVVDKTIDSGPFCESNLKENELVSRGFAEFVGDSGAKESPAKKKARKR